MTPIVADTGRLRSPAPWPRSGSPWSLSRLGASLWRVEYPVRTRLADHPRRRVLARGEGALAEALTRWCENTAAPVVLLIDEIDTLIGDTLIAVLRQLRARYDRRPESFPQSVVLCGVRDVRDYRIRSSAENAAIAGGSAFNIRAESLRLGDFTEPEVRALLEQHTREAGQPFTAEALETVWRQTRGQPWLVNALCRRVCFDDARGPGPGPDRAGRPPRIANPIYAEIVPRELAYPVQAKLIEDVAWYVDADGGLDVDRLLGLIVWPRGGGPAPDAAEADRFVIECKVAHKGLDRTIDEGVVQTAAYMDRCAARTGHLVVFDRRADRSWDERIFRRDVDRDGRPITVWGM